MEKAQSINECVKESITIALLNLMRKKSFSEIKVTEIVKAAGVGRTSFYRNFESREDVLKKYINQLYSDYFLTHKIPDSLSTENERREHLRSRYQFIKNNSEFFILLNKNNLLYEVFESIDNEIFKKIIIFDMDNPYLFAFSSSGCVGVIKEWINRRFKESEDELVDIFIDMNKFR